MNIITVLVLKCCKNRITGQNVATFELNIFEEDQNVLAWVKKVTEVHEQMAL